MDNSEALTLAAPCSKLDNKRNILKCVTARVSKEERWLTTEQLLSSVPEKAWNAYIWRKQLTCHWLRQWIFRPLQSAVMIVRYKTVFLVFFFKWKVKQQTTWVITESKYSGWGSWLHISLAYSCTSNDKHPFNGCIGQLHVDGSGCSSSICCVYIKCSVLDALSLQNLAISRLFVCLHSSNIIFSLWWKNKWYPNM